MGMVRQFERPKSETDHCLRNSHEFLALIVIEASGRPLSNRHRLPQAL